MRVNIIAEAGVNHNGDILMAEKLIKEAARAGADYVKFQTFKADKLVDKSAKKAKYQEETTGEGGQYEMLKQLELSESDHHYLVKVCQENNIKFLSTGFDVDSLEFLVEEIKIDLIKIPSGEINNYFLLKKTAEYNLPTVISTGMCTLEEVEESIAFLLSHGLSKDKLTVLHCTTAYPTPMSEVNLNVLETYKSKLDCQIGYSDHTLGNEVCIASVGMGAVLIEKHFTLDKSLPGPDHKASMEPQQLCDLVEAIRNLEEGMGSFIKQPTSTEVENKKIARKSLFFAKDIAKGEVIKEEHLTAKRPGEGINPLRLEDLLGKVLNVDIVAGTQVKLSHYV